MVESDPEQFLKLKFLKYMNRFKLIVSWLFNATSFNFESGILICGFGET